MKKVQSLFILLSLCIIINKADAQLSGSYTIGGISPNYATFDAAINDLGLHGISGPVVFNIRPGTYVDSVECRAISGSSPSNTVTFQSETLDSTSVTIAIPHNWNTLFNSIDQDYFALNELTFYENDSNSFAIWMENLSISNSVIYAPYTGGIEIDYGTASIKNSVITCATSISYIYYPVFVSGNILNGSLGIAYGAYSPSVITGNIINGTVELSYDTCVLFRHNTVNDPAIYQGAQFGYGNWDSIEYNQFNAQCWINYPTNPSVVIGNRFSCPQDSGTAFEMFVDPNPQIINNTIYGNININTGGGSGATFIGNRIYEGTANLEDQHDFISNNYIRETFFTSGDMSEIYNNNFSSPGGLNLGGNLCTVKNNNFPNGVVRYSSNNIISHNNYYPTASLYDSTQTNYNPQYPDTINIHTENVHLIKKGAYLSQVKYDIDSILRNNPPTIGANELCISNNDTINLFCGDSVNLFMCGTPNSGTFSWSPSIGLNNAFIATPAASPSVSTLYHVTGSVGGFHDSVYINIVPFKVQAFQDTVILHGDSTMLLATYNANAIYQWLPTVGLKSPNSYKTQTNPNITTVYTVTATVPGCGTTVDSVRIVIACLNYNDEPICMTTIDTSNNKCEIIWGRTNSPPAGGYGYYSVYKDSTSGYELTHTQPLDSLSEFVDINSNPTLGPVSYELATVDSCGQSALSAPHTTIFLTTTSGINAFILNWTAYVGFTPSKYRIFRGPALNNMVQIDSVPSSVLTFTDSFPPLGSYYAVEAVSPFGVCVPTSHRPNHSPSLSGSFSNGFNTATLGIQNMNSTVNKVNIFPNPSNGAFTLSYSLSTGGNVQTTILNELGQIVYNNTEQRNSGNITEQLNLENLASGIYSLRMQTNNGSIVRKIVLMRN